MNTNFGSHIMGALLGNHAQRQNTCSCSTEHSILQISKKKKKLVCGQSDSLLHRFPLYIDLSHFGHQLHLLTWFHLSLFKTYYKGAQILKDIESFV